MIVCSFAPLAFFRKKGVRFYVIRLVAVRRGLLLALFSGTLTLVAVSMSGYVSLIVLISGRFLLGLSESLLITGALAWGIGLAGPKNAGKVMSWSGMAMYGSIAASSPLSFLSLSHFGFPGAITFAILLPFLAGLISMLVASSPATGVERIPFYKVLPLVWKQGMGLAFAAVSFAGIAGLVANAFGYPAVFALAVGACMISFLFAISLKQNKEFL